MDGERQAARLRLADFRLRPGVPGLRRDEMPRQAGSAEGCRRRPAEASRATPRGPLVTGQRLDHQKLSPGIPPNSPLGAITKPNGIGGIYAGFPFRIT